jgi:DNA-directed RNA polymerase specialized sigma24 family protein
MMTCVPSSPAVPHLHPPCARDHHAVTSTCGEHRKADARRRQARNELLARERFNEMLTTIYPQLRLMAAARFASRGTSPTSLAQETVCRLIALPSPPTEAESALAMSFQLMEWTSIDRYRSRTARCSRELAVAIASRRHVDERTPSSRWSAMLDHLAASISMLADRKPRAIEILVLTSICRMTQHAIAQALGVCIRTVRDDLKFAKAFIAAQVKIRMAKAA